MNDTLSNRQLIRYSLLILLFGIIVGSVSLTYPFGRDQGIYAYIGKLLLEGKIQYKYAFDLKPPGVHYVFALAELFFGQNMFNFRLFDIVWESFTGIVLFLIAFNLTRSKIAGIISAFLYIFLYYRLDYWHTLQADGFLNLPFSLCVLMLISSRINEIEVKLIAAGIFFALSILFKYTILVFLLFLIPWFFIYRTNLLKIRIKNFILFISGFALTLALVTVIYYFSDSLQQFINVQFVQIPLYTRIGYNTESFSFIVSNILRLIFGSVYSPLLLSCGLLGLVLLWKKSIRNDKTILFIWIISTIISLIAQWKFFQYHFLVIIPPLAVATSVFFSIVFNMYHNKYPMQLNLIFGIILLTYITLSGRIYIINYSNVLSFIEGKKNLNELYIENGVTSDSAFMISNTFKAVDYVKANTRESDGIFIWGFDPVVYFLSGRYCVSRFIYNFPLYWKGNNSSFRNEFMEAIKTNNPKLILVSQKDPLYYISGYQEDSKEMISRFPVFKQFLEDNYILTTQIDDFYFYELKK